MSQFYLIDKDGNVYGYQRFASVVEAARRAKELWPNQEQDPERSGRGWDVQAVGAGNG